MLHLFPAFLLLYLVLLGVFSGVFVFSSVCWGTFLNSALFQGLGNEIHYGRIVFPEKIGADDREKPHSAPPH